MLYTKTGKQQKHVLQSKYSTQYDPFEFFEEVVNHKEKFEELSAVWLSDDMQWVMSIERKEKTRFKCHLFGAFEHKISSTKAISYSKLVYRRRGININSMKR